MHRLTSCTLRDCMLTGRRLTGRSPFYDPYSLKPLLRWLLFPHSQLLSVNLCPLPPTKVSVSHDPIKQF